MMQNQTPNSRNLETKKLLLDNKLKWKIRPFVELHSIDSTFLRNPKQLDEP